MEAWNWLERDGMLIPDPIRQGWHLISRRGEELLGRYARFERLEKLGLDRVKHDLLNGGVRWVGGTMEQQEEAWEWVRMKEGQAMLPAANRARTNRLPLLSDDRLNEPRKLPSSGTLSNKETIVQDIDKENISAASQPQGSAEFVPKRMYHASKASVTVYHEREEAELGQGWSTNYTDRDYPRWKYHWTKNALVVKNPQEETALGGGWADTPAAFERFKGVRPPRTDQQDPTKWVNEWALPGLSVENQNGIKAVLLRADAAFSKSPDADSADLAAMKQAFDGIAKVLFEAGILTEQVLRSEISLLVWESAIAAGWWRSASEKPLDIFPERIGHYWVWRDESKDWAGFFRAETASWLSNLLEGSPQGKPARRERKRNAGLERLKLTVRKLRAAGLSHKDICDRLGSNPRPPHASCRGGDSSQNTI